MLILARKERESIVIRDDIVVTVTKIRAGKVRLGIKAPSDVTVHRREVNEKAGGAERIGRRDRGNVAPQSRKRGG